MFVILMKRHKTESMHAASVYCCDDGKVHSSHPDGMSHRSAAALLPRDVRLYSILPS